MEKIERIETTQKVEQMEKVEKEREKSNRAISSQRPKKVATKVNNAKDSIERSILKIEDAQSAEVSNTRQEHVTDQRKKIHHYHSKDYRKESRKRVVEKENSLNFWKKRSQSWNKVKTTKIPIRSKV